MIRISIVILSFVATSLAFAEELDHILAMNANAHGGEAYSDIQAIKVELHIKEPTFEVTGTYIASREGLMRIDIYSGKERVFAEGLTSKCAWEWNPGQSAEELGACVGETETGALRHGIEMPGNFYTLKDVGERGAKVYLVGEIETDSGPEWQVRVTLSDGFSRDYFISQESNRITRARDYRAFHPGIDPTEVAIETRFEDPESIEGVLRFRQQVNVNADTGEVLGTTTVRSVEFNPDVSAETFEAGWVPVGEAER